MVARPGRLRIDKTSVIEPTVSQNTRTKVSSLRRLVCRMIVVLSWIALLCGSVTTAFLETHEFHHRSPCGVGLSRTKARRLFPSCTTTTGTTRMMTTRLTSDNTPSSSTVKLVCVGEVLFDCIATDRARGWSVEHVVAENEWKAFPGGANANVAAAFGKLNGASTAAFVGCVGDDADGRALLRELSQGAGVNVQGVQTRREYPTRRIMVTRSLDGDRAFGGFWGDLKADEFADAYLQADELFPAAGDVLKHAQWMVCGTLSLAFPVSANAIETLVHWGLQNCDVRLFVDVNWRPVIWNDTTYTEDEIRCIILDFIARHKAHAVKLTDEEAEWLLGIPAAEALNDPSRVHAAFPHAMAVLITAGEKGASYSMLGCAAFVKPCSVQIVETTGAGDAFSAGFLYQWMELEQALKAAPPQSQAKMVEQIIHFASAVGALTCTKEGAIAAQPLLADVETFLQNSS
jgi:fructokinase